jgi:site-specific DNA-adenine methylase
MHPALDFLMLSLQHIFIVDCLIRHNELPDDAYTYVENLSWQECVKRYDRAHTFFYLAPPYWQAERYGVPFGFEQYQEMAEVMRSCKGKVMVSINDHPDIRQAFDGFHMMAWTSSMQWPASMEMSKRARNW